MARKDFIAAWLDKAFAVGGVKPQLDVKISGDHEALKALEALPTEVAKRVLRAALKKSQEPGLSAAGGGNPDRHRPYDRWPSAAL